MVATGHQCNGFGEPVKTMASIGTETAIEMSYSQQYPHYGFDRHKGYPTKAHMATLAEHGPCPEHRRSYAPVRRCLVGKV